MHGYFYMMNCSDKEVKPKSSCTGAVGFVVSQGHLIPLGLTSVSLPSGIVIGAEQQVLDLVSFTNPST